MKDEQTLWRQLLHVTDPWAICDCHWHDNAHRFDVWIGLEAPRGWFGLGRPRRAVDILQRSWRHVNLGLWEVHVHIAAPTSLDLTSLPWTGDPDLPFTRALSQQVFSYLNEGCSLPSICTLLRLPFADLWRFHHALDSGRWSAGSASWPGGRPHGGAHSGRHAASAHRPGTMNGASAHAPLDHPAEAGEESGIPPSTDPVWAGLLDGSRDIQVRALGLQLLLTRLRKQFEHIRDEEVRMLKLQDLHRYFLRNRAMLSHELDQLRDL